MQGQNEMHLQTIGGDTLSGEPYSAITCIIETMFRVSDMHAVDPFQDSR